MADCLSKRGKHTFDNFEFLHNYSYKIYENEYKPITNPSGIINLGAAENKLMENEIEKWFDKDNSFKFDSTKHTHYYKFGGIGCLKIALIAFYQKFINAPEDLAAEEFTAFNGGVSACLDAISHAIFDAGDYYITPTPAYARIFTNFNIRSQAIPVELVLSSEPDESGKTFNLSSQMLEDKILELHNQGIKPKGFVLINPNNPLGDVYSRGVLESILHVCHKYKMHVVVDEIYALSIFGSNTDQTVSIISMPNVPDPMRTHTVWGISKDFGLAGLRFGIVHTKNPAIQKTLSDLSVFSGPSTLVQYAMTEFLSDLKWIQEFYIPQYKKRLSKNYDAVKILLESHGIYVRPSEAGLFIWASFKKFLPEQNFVMEMELFQEFLDAGIYIIPGKQLYCKVPGWFRIIVTTYEDELEKGIKRLVDVLELRKAKLNKNC